MKTQIQYTQDNTSGFDDNQLDEINEAFETFYAAGNYAGGHCDQQNAADDFAASEIGRHLLQC